MKKENPPLKPPVANDIVLSQLRQLHEAVWPANLYRYAIYTLSDDEEGVAYIAVAWEPDSRTLYAQTINVGTPPPACRIPRPINVDAQDWASRVRPIAKLTRPRCMEVPLANAPVSSLVGWEDRVSLVKALLMVDTVGKGRPSDFIVNDFIIIDSSLRSQRIEEMRKAIGGGKGFRSYVLKVVTRFFWYGGDYGADDGKGWNTLLARTEDRGGPGKRRLSPATKPGPLSAKEKLAKARAQANGKEYVRKARRVDAHDIENMKEGLELDWAGGDKVSLATTQSRMIPRRYKYRPVDDTPSYRRMRYRYKEIVQDNGLLALRNGPQATSKDVDPRPGTSSELTQSVIEILDIDGFHFKIPVGARVLGKVQAVPLILILAISRLTGALRGYAICTQGETGEGYQRCLISALLPMDYYLSELGLDPLPGLLTGNFDGICNDNGPGKSRAVRSSVTNSYGGIMFNPPGARPDLRPVGERFNEILIRIVSEQTEQGYSRENNLFERAKRRERSKLSPILPRPLERVVLQAIDVYNRTTDKSKLRTARMRDADCGITPDKLHEYHQKRRHGQGARIRSADEVFDTFLPWTKRTCNDARVHWENARYSSAELKDAAIMHSRRPGKEAFVVEVKSPYHKAGKILCRIPEGEVFEIEMIEEDKIRFGEDLTWLELTFAKMDDDIRRAEAAHEKAKLTQPTKRKSAQRVSVKTQQQLDDIEGSRTDEFAGAVGATKSAAKRNSKAFRAQQLLEQQKIAYGANGRSADEADTEGTTSGTSGNTTADDTQSSDDPLADAARLAERAYLARGKQGDPTK
ncbi:hypothetical protein AWB78_05621 [Caballeronia calidae]|uniref:Uncharacterized protein n=1 Tax=Caballeronia calidae TaxID=1777139 RepID=A0A158DU46_9BURK|nr:hypothetical protein [Caballeronia calidae]SAK98142.1 hypothetical protein AWB78_05621 [Caballeronia calidae]